MFWAKFPKPGNVGDLIGPYLYRMDTGREPEWEQPKNPSLITCGSVIRFAGPDTTVWGAGHIQAGDHSHPQARYVAVRGPRTREMVLADGGDCPPVYGDPALCLRHVFMPSTEQHGKPVMVPHYVDRVRCFPYGGGWRIVSPLTTDVEAFASALASAPYVLSSSLHGIVIAHAYSVPAAWLRISDEVVGDGFKFRDYCEGIGREAVCVDLRAGGPLRKRVVERCLIPPPDTEGIRRINHLWSLRPWHSV